MSADIFFYGLFGVIAAFCSLVEYGNQKQAGAENKSSSYTSAFLTFRNNYLTVYALMMAGDWLQGPYVYRLYEHYGYSVGDIGKLFIAGFGSSMVFGTVVGSLSDKFGRKKAALLYVVTYIASCITKHYSTYSVLMLGRVFGGIATSLLFSAFESWLVAEHFKRGFDGAWLGPIFSKAVFIGNGLVAILSGLLANYLVRNLDLGPVAPFDAAIVLLAIGGVLIFATWPENHGNESSKDSEAGGIVGGIHTQLTKGLDEIRKDKSIALLGAMQALFEGAMYTFVFLWTPALSPNGEDVPHGFIFATLMLASMVGSAFAGRLLSANRAPETYMAKVFLTGAGALAIPVVAPLIFPEESVFGANQITVSGTVQLLAFCVFEAVVGLFWPSMMKMRSVYVPEEHRATIINIFRIPLNLFVCVVLYNVDMFAIRTMFIMCSIFLCLAFFCQTKLSEIALAKGAQPSVSVGMA